MTTAEIITAIGGLLAFAGILGMIAEILLTIWNVKTWDYLARLAVTFLLIGFVLFFVGIAAGGCPDCRFRRY